MLVCCCCCFIFGGFVWFGFVMFVFWGTVSYSPNWLQSWNITKTDFKLLILLLHLCGVLSHRQALLLGKNFSMLHKDTHEQGESNLTRQFLLAQSVWHDPDQGSKHTGARSLLSFYFKETDGYVSCTDGSFIIQLCALEKFKIHHNKGWDRKSIEFSGGI